MNHHSWFGIGRSGEWRTRNSEPLVWGMLSVSLAIFLLAVSRFVSFPTAPAILPAGLAAGIPVFDAEHRPLRTLEDRIGVQFGMLNESTPFHSDEDRATLRQMGIRSGIRPEQLVFVQEVTAGSFGEEAGLHPFDIVTHVDGVAVTHPRQIRELISAKEGGETVMLRILRYAKPSRVVVRVGPRPAEPISKRLATNWGIIGPGTL